jgi:CDP-diacylglycerol--serine O-phosphatidyltransferase
VVRKRKRLKYIAVLPTAVTLMNALCGFLSIVYASRGPGIYMEVFLLRKQGISLFAMSGFFILIAMIADVMDGQVARWSGSASSFGGQLDSLSDVISFGVAPAFLMYKVMVAHFGLENAVRKFFFPVSLWEAFPQVSPRLVQLAGRWMLFIAIFYVLCVVIRLARFNVENDTDLSHHQNFIGLPSPAAAGVVSSLIIFQEDFIHDIADRFPEFSSSLMDITSWLLPFTVFSCGILMVTRIRYPHVANRLFRKKKNFVKVLLVFFVFLFAIWNIELAVLLGFWGFALMGFFRSMYTGIVRALSRSRAKEQEKTVNS